MKLVSPSELGESLGVSARTVRNWTKRGIITAEIKVGAVYRFDPAKVRKQLAKTTAEAIAKEPEPTRLPHYL